MRRLVAGGGTGGEIIFIATADKQAPPPNIIALFARLEPLSISRRAV